MPHAFYLQQNNWSQVGDECLLLDGEARHLMQVLRLQVGEEIHILDGEGQQGLCRITKISKKEVCLQLLHKEIFSRPPALPIMALAFSKATRRGFFMEKAVELGVHEVWLWQGEHSQGKIPFEVKEHWQSQCIAAMKQCRNPWLPKVRILQGGAKALVQESLSCAHKFLPYEGQENVTMLNQNMLGQDGLSLYVIGPEGGFSENEINLFVDHNFKMVSLGKRVLRCETAALLCLGLHWWASQSK